MSLDISLEPIPTQVTPESNQDFKLSYSIETPPVGITEVQG